VPTLSRWLVRAALCYLVAGFTLGAVILVSKALGTGPFAWSLLPAHVEFLLFGWTVQLTMGVAFWILPRFAGGASRGDERLVWAAFALVNAGTLATALAPLAGSAGVTIGRVLEATAAAAFGAHAWRRVKRPSV
jgi:heme/copper-type cytochrome/quinol oxidase subunit 1